MPAEGIHLTALREAIASPSFPAAARRATTRHEAAARLGSVVLDLPYFDRYLAEVARYALKRPPRPSPFGQKIHEEAAVPVARAVLERARETRSDRLAAVALGLVSHASMDRQLHPLVNALARRYHDGLGHDAAHREVEKFQSIAFHEDYLGCARLMGTTVVVRLVEVPIAELFRDYTLVDTLASAFTEACAMPMPRSLLTRMGRGYAQHARVLGSPLGARVASEAERARAETRFLRGGWGSFDDVLARAVSRSVDVLERAWTVYTAGDADVPAARRALDEALPLGTIDPPGLEVDLERSFPA